MNKKNIHKIILLLLVMIICIIYFFKTDIVEFAQFLSIKNFYSERKPKNKADINLVYSYKDEKLQYYITDKYTGEGEIDYTIFIMNNVKLIANYSFSLPQSPIFSTFYFQLDNKTILFGDLKTKGWDENFNEIKGVINKIEFHNQNEEIFPYDLKKEQKFYLFIINGNHDIEYVKVYSNNNFVTDSKYLPPQKIEIEKNDIQIPLWE